MIFCIITHVSHGHQNDGYFAYAPYVREMNVWSEYVDKIILVAPLNLKNPTAIDLAYFHKNIEFRKVSAFNFLNFKDSVATLFKLPKISIEIYKAMKNSDHIHLRCPGNMGLMGCLIQVLFPAKPKTAKYAGNWDPKSKQPLSYRLQKWILKNTLLTKNMQVLVYGDWENGTKNIKSFFTASYYEKDKIEVKPRELKDTIKFVFVGTLSNGKQPLYAVRLVEQLLNKEHNVQLEIYGQGAEKDMIQNYIIENQLENRILLKGNQSQETIKQAYIDSHFTILPSLSEGWPKVVAEAMFWGCLPIASKVSCVPNMLGNGERGLLLDLNLMPDVNEIESILNDENLYQDKAAKAMQWSRQFTMDAFENEIKSLLHS